MRRGVFTEDQIISVLREHEAGVKTAELCRKYGISDGTFYNCKAKYGGITVSEAARLRTLEDENQRLKKLLAESMLDLSALKDLLGKTDPVCESLCCGGEADGRPRLLRASSLQADRGQPFGVAMSRFAGRTMPYVSGCARSPTSVGGLATGDWRPCSGGRAME